MDLQKAKIFLDKINREYARMAKEPENITRIDVDIICAYTREMYDAFLSDTPRVTVVGAAPTSKSHAGAFDFTPERPNPKSARAPEPPTVIAPPPPVQVAPPPPVQVAPPPPVQVAPPPPVQVTPPPPPVQVAPPPPEPPVFQGYFPPEVEALFEEKKARELSEKLAQSRIADLTRHIALNDKLLYTSQLFGGNNLEFNETLKAINGFGSFTEAKYYLMQNFVSKYDWTNKTKVEFAKDLIQLVRRRFN